MSLTSGSRVLRYKWTELPMPTDVINRVNTIYNDSFSLPLFSSELLLLNEDQYNTMPDTYGLIILDVNFPYPFMAYNVRVRTTGDDDDTIDFAMPIPIR